MTAQEKLQQTLTSYNLKEVTKTHLEQLKYMRDNLNCEEIECKECILGDGNSLNKIKCYDRSTLTFVGCKKKFISEAKEIIDAVEQCNSQKYNDNIDLITLEVSEEFNNCVMINIKYNCDKVESLVLEDGFEFNFNKNYLFETGIFKCLLEDIKSTIDKTNKELSKQNLTPEEYYSQIPEVEFKHGEENYHIYWSFTFNKYIIDYVRCNKFLGLKYITKEDAEKFCEIYNNKLV